MPLGDSDGLAGFYLLGMWYRRSEAQKRFSFFFSSTTLAGAFGGALAYGISQMSGDRGYSGWRWVFIIEGCITCVAAFILFFFMPDFPEDVKWLTDEEREFVRAKLAKDVGKSAHHVSMGWREVVAVFKDCKFPLGLDYWYRLDTDWYNRQGHSWRLDVLRSHRSGLWLVTLVNCLSASLTQVI